MAGFKKKIKKYGRDILGVLFTLFWVAIVHIFLVGINFHYYFTACMPENSYTCTFFGLVCAGGYFMDATVLMISFMIAFITGILLLGFLPAVATEKK